MSQRREPQDSTVMTRQLRVGRRNVFLSLGGPRRPYRIEGFKILRHLLRDDLRTTSVGSQTKPVPIRTGVGGVTFVPLKVPSRNTTTPPWNDLSVPPVPYRPLIPLRTETSVRPKESQFPKTVLNVRNRLIESGRSRPTSPYTHR